MRTKWIAAAAALFYAAGFGAACGEDEKKEKTADKTAADKQRPARKTASQRAIDEQGASGQKSAEGFRTTAASGFENLAAGFKHWQPVEQFLSAKVRQVKALDARVAMVLLQDNHVGVTEDGGKHWCFRRLLYGRPRALGGRPGGPYFAVGEDGYAALTPKCRSWQNLPLVTDQDFIGVLFALGKAIAIGNRGAVVTFAKDGTRSHVFQLPKGKRPRAIYRIGKNPFIQVGSREVWATGDGGKTWQAMETPPELPSEREALTRQGVCKLGRVGKTRGMVCTVKGTGFGLAKGEVAVVSRDTIQVTRDDGKSWKVSKSPLRTINRIRGYAGGPYFAVGRSGGLARSQDGRSWIKKPLDTKSNLKDVHIQGDTVVAAGTGGTVVRSSDRGKTWRVITVQPAKSFTHIVAQGKKLVLPVGTSALVSRDGGQSWTEAADPAALGELPSAPRVGKCANSLPAVGAACRFSREVRSPEKLPRMRMFHFRGDTGIAAGDQGLVAVTVDGGASWQTRYGAGLRGGVQELALLGKRVVVLSKRSVFVSPDGGRSWVEGILPKGIGTLNTVFLQKGGPMFIAGDRATLLKSVGSSGKAWVALDTGARRSTSFVKINGANGVLYLSGSRGSLYRSTDGGKDWQVVVTALRRPVAAVAATADTVYAVTAAHLGRRYFKGDNLLLQSDDGGKHFRVRAAISPGGMDAPFSVDPSGALHYANLVSKDGGWTWTKHRKHWVRGAVPVQDGSGRYVGNWGYRRYRRGRFAFYVFDATFEKRMIVERIYHEDAVLRCNKQTGCWMVCDTNVYRPVPSTAQPSNASAAK
jgi:photosystem II stability/assembly factor-like uncharacterized protein